ncbi:MAG: type II toxin-antitoxin system RatA family toxin [Nitrososphaerales archaeon]
MPRIQESIEINASRDRVWEIVADLDNEPEYWWGTKVVSNVQKNGNVITRDIVQNFRNHTISQKIILKPKDEIEIRYIKGLTEGMKYLKLDTIDQNTQKLTAIWRVRFPGIYVLLTPFIGRHIRKGTIEALQRIKKASEQTRSIKG